MISQKKGYYILPATPTLLKQYGIDSPKYLEYRESIINTKYSDKIYNEQLRPYQNQAVNFLLSEGNKACFDEQRLGKTPTVLTVIKEMNVKALIVTPKSLTYQWYNEYKKWVDDDVVLIDGPVGIRKALYRTCKSIIMSYNTLSTDEQYILGLKHLGIMVIDEAHRIRNLKKGVKNAPKEAKAVIKIGKQIPKRIALTGTPANNYADDIFGILSFLYPDIFTSYYNFSNYYFKQKDIYTRQNGQLKIVTTCSGKFKEGKEQELLELLELISIQRKRKDVMQWLPDYNIEKMVLPMTAVQADAYNTLSQYYELNDTIILNNLELMNAQKQLTILPELFKVLDTGCKINFLLDYIKDYPEKQIIVVSTFVKPLNYLKDLLKTEIIEGSTSAKKRDEIKNRFQNKEINILLASLEVIKEGFQLDTADTIIFLDSSYIYTSNIQCMDRLVPVSKERLHKAEQNIIILVAEDSIDEYIYDMVYIKKADSSDIINNYIKNLERTTKWQQDSQSQMQKD